MMTGPEFCLKWLRRAWKRAYSTAGLIGFVLSIGLAGVINVIGWLLGTGGWAMVGWFIPVIVFSIFVLAFVCAVVTAPYTMYRELETDNAALQARLDDDVSRVSLSDSLEVAKQRIRELRERGKREEPTDSGACDKRGLPGSELPRIRAEFAQWFKAELLKVVEDAVNKPLGEAGYPTLKPDEIESADDVRKMYPAADRLVERLTAIQSQLAGPSGRRMA